MKLFLKHSNSKHSNYRSLFTFLFWITLLNIVIWIPMLLASFPTIGLGHDSQIFTAAIHSELREQNGLFSLSPKLLDAREDIFSYPYFGILYPFYFTLGVNESLSYETNLILDFISVVFHMVLASLTFTVLLKRMGCKLSISILFGLFYAYSMNMKMWSSWIWALSGYTWIPLCLLGIWETIHQRNYRLGFLLMTCGFGFIALGSGLPLVYAVTISAGFFFFTLLKTQPTNSELRNIFTCIFLSGACSLAIGASHLLPTLYHSSEYIRWYSGGAITGSFKPPYEGTLSKVLEFSPQGLMQFILPTTWYGIGHPFIGLACIATAFFYILKHWKNFFIYPLLLLALYFLFDAFGDATPVHRITYSIPLLGSVRYPLANLYLTQTVLLLFGALGISELLKSDKVQAKWWVLFFGFTCVFGAGLFWLYQDDLIAGAKDLSPFWYLIQISIGVLVIINFKSNYRGKLMILAIASMLPLNTMLVHPKVPNENTLYSACTDFSEIVSAFTEVRLKTTGAHRLAIHRNIDFKSDTSSCLSKLKLSPRLIGSAALMSGWEVDQIYLSPRPVKEFRLFNRLSNHYKSLDYNNLIKAGISHIMLPKDFELSLEQKDNLEFIAKARDYPIFLVKRSAIGLSALGCIKKHAKPASSIFVSDNDERAITGLPSSIANNKKYHCIDDQDKPAQLLESKRHGSSLTHRISTTNSNSIFITDQVFHTAWRATVDGKKVKPFKVDGYRLALEVPRGSTAIKLRYAPTTFVVGVILTFIGILLMALVALSLILSWQNWFPKTIDP